MKKKEVGAFVPFPIVPIALVGANVEGKPNFAAVGFTGGVNTEPAILSISLNKRHYTSEGILENETFSINIPSSGQTEAVDYCGLVSGREADKSGLFSVFYGRLKTAPMIDEFPIVCECRYIGKKVEFSADTLYFGEIIQVYIDHDLLGQNRDIDVLKADPLCFSGLENK